MVASAKKTDNGNIRAKLELRRYFLHKYHTDGQARVLDCCQGRAMLWRQLAGEFELGSYWSLDLKPNRGRLKLDSTRLLEQPGWEFDVIDVDTYGLPWTHYEGILRNLSQPAVTVFLTLGSVRTGGGGTLSAPEIAALGLSFSRLKLPPSFSAKLLRKTAVSYC